jgi:hypothetical protein
MFPAMKTDNVALQLSEKCMAKRGVRQGKNKILMSFKQNRRLPSSKSLKMTSLASSRLPLSANLTEYRP